MKTSNILFISFLIFLFGGIIFLCVGSKYYEVINDPANFSRKEKKIATFSVVVAEPGAFFYLRNAKENKIVQSSKKGSVANFPTYIVRNDTLFVSSRKPIKDLAENYSVATDIFCVALKKIVAKENSNVNLMDFNADTLNISTIKSRLDLRFKNISCISLQSKDSDIYLEGEKLEKLVVNLDKTKLNAPIKKRIENLSGSLKNTSDCTFYLSNKIILDVDKTSTYNFYNF
ncbi:hypothetical protein AAGV33_05790 [Flavobacterium sp. FBOR7N2.3]|uniref:Auto-transporter adhesin head GIN domain-containing protein n=1 Tax=Flavobacterium magnesitis TaxID=3138077 RepID=A0ABV4TIJ0_9FLAO